MMADQYSTFCDPDSDRSLLIANSWPKMTNVWYIQHIYCKKYYDTRPILLGIQLY